MFPVFYIFGKQIGMYGVCAVLGFIAVGLVGARLGKRRDIAGEDIILGVLAVAIGLFVGGHILFGLTNIGTLVQLIKNVGSYTFRQILNGLVAIFGGSVFYGGLLGGIAAIFVFCRISKNIARSDLLDIMAVCVPLFHTFGRIGCFLGGCCYGIPSSFGFTVTENPINPAVCGVNRFPVQLVEAGCNLVIFFILLKLFGKERLSGRMIYIYMLIYPVVRFILEFFRGDEIRGIWFGLSTSQWISIALFAFAICKMTVIARRSRVETKI